jgi:hypothetical protein
VDSFANSTQRTITVDVAFGGSAGQNSGSNQSQVQATSSGDTAIGTDDTWVAVANPSSAGVSSRGPHAVVLGSRSGAGNFQRDPFGNALPAAGLEANFYGYKNTLMQFVGRAFEDAKMLGFGHALEQQLGGAGHIAPASFGAFTPGVAREYTASTTANVISTAGHATLTVSDPSAPASGHLVNGSFSLPAPLKAGGTVLPAALKTWAGPTSNEAVGVSFTQAIGATDALRTGTYSKTLTYTLSTTTP